MRSFLRIKATKAPASPSDQQCPESFKVARRRYRQFIKNGIDQGKCPEFQGGGLVRSAGGEKAGLLGRRKEEREKGDQRILGSGDFVGDVLRKAGEQLESMTKKRMFLDEIIAIVANSTETSIEDLKSTGLKRKLAHARAVIAYVEIRNIANKLNSKQLPLPLF